MNPKPSEEAELENKNSPKAVNATRWSPSESICQKCEGVNPVWFAPNKLWNKFAGEYHFLCPNCFIGLVGKNVKVWEVSPEQLRSLI